ncbi:MAG: thermonuclease family protein [Halanaeroarchaeum sp.]
MDPRGGVVASVFVVLVVSAGCVTTGPSIDFESGPVKEDLSNDGPESGTAWEVTIARVVDGDTVEARFPNGEIEELRLLGVDAPETYRDGVTPGEFEGIPDTESGREHLLAWGERASAFATDELEGETVRVAVDPSADRRGGYGRLLVYVYADGELFNERLLTEGYARLYDTEFVLRDSFAAAEAAARNDERGLWAFDGSARAVPINPRIRGAAHMSSASDTPSIAPHSEHS